MKRMVAATAMAICGIFLLVSIHEASAADYSVKVSNTIRNTTNEVASVCNPVYLSYWAGATGTRAQASDTLGAFNPQTLTVRNTGACSSMEITATCHYFQTSYTNKGKLSETSWGHWVDETKTQSIPCGCHAASVGLALVQQGSVANTVMAITCP